MERSEMKVYRDETKRGVKKKNRGVRPGSGLMNEEKRLRTLLSWPLIEGGRSRSVPAEVSY